MERIRAEMKRENKDKLLLALHSAGSEARFTAITSRNLYHGLATWLTLQMSRYPFNRPSEDPLVALGFT